MLSDKLFGTFLGIEFKEKSIIVTYMKNSMSGIMLLASSSFSLTDRDIAVNEIRDYVSKHGVDINRVFVSIPDRWAINKFTDVPSMKGKGKSSLVNLMKFEIERHIPYEIDDVDYDFLVMEERDSTYSVVFTAVQKEKMDYVRDFLDKVSLRPDAVTISSFAVLNAIELSGKPAGGWQEIIGIVRKSNLLGKQSETNISLYIEKDTATLAIIRNGLCSYLKTYGVRPDEPQDSMIDDTAKYLAEIQSAHAIDHFDKLILSGYLSSYQGLEDKLKEKFSTDVVTIDRIIDMPGNPEGIETGALPASVGAVYTGLGIGTYGINLLPHKREFEIKKIAPSATKIFLVLILALLIGIFAADAVKQKRFLARMEKTLNSNEPVVSELEKITADINSLKKRSDYLRDVKEKELTLEILAELTRVLPRDSWVTTLNYKGFDIKSKKSAGGELIISGYAASSSSLIPLLEDSLFLEKVEFVGPIKKTRNKEQFKLSAEVVLPYGEESEEQ